MQTKLLTKRIPYTFVRGGYYYFSRRVPTDLQCHYNYPRIVQGLQTSSPQKAKVQANLEAAKLDAYWSQMRLAKSDVIGLSLLKASSTSDRSTAISFPNAEAVLSKSSPTLLDALQVYLDQKGKGRPKTFRLAAERVCNYVIGISGNCPSSYKMGHRIDLSIGGSGSYVGLIMQPAFDVASGDTGLSVS